MDIERELKDWLISRPKWQIEATRRILSDISLDNSDYEELAEICKNPDGYNIESDLNLNQLISHVSHSDPLYLISMRDICGIDLLNPKKPLIFDENNIVVIYGKNGSGKSGYVRILKKICGKANAKPLRKNVFGEMPEKSSCVITYKTNELIEKEWCISDPYISELQSIDLFDTDSDSHYLKNDTESTYVPKIVAFFDCLVKSCEGVKKRLNQEKLNLVKTLPTFPTEYSNSDAANIYQSLNANLSEKDLNPILIWTEEDNEKLNDIEGRLKAENPSELAKNTRLIKSEIDNLSLEITNVQSLFSPESYQKLISLKKEAINKRKIAIEGAEQALKSSSLNGVGTETWRSLWEAARKYSEEKAYPTSIFPNISEGSKCVLCQQPLSPDGQHRLEEFEAFVKGELENDANIAELEFQKEIDTFPVIKSEREIKTNCLAAGLNDKTWIERLNSFWQHVGVIKKIILDQNTGNNSEENTLKTQYETQLSSTFTENVTKTHKNEGITEEHIKWICELHKISQELDRKAISYDNDELSIDRNKLEREFKELKAKHWISQQSECVKSELSRLKQIAQYDKWIEETNSTAISRKAGDIAEEILTDEYIARFNRELEKLGGKGIKVELVKAKVDHGKVLHRIKLSNVNENSVSPMDVLSEGEKRIIALSAFLADVTGENSKAPFIFDDPISSLDQDFEEKTIDRLIELSSNRQVIIFTHRLSFLGILCNRCDPCIICITREPWGSGEPGDILISEKHPDKALNVLLNYRLPEAKNTLENNGSREYYPLGKAICSDFRILMEKIVEIDLLADVIQRHRREVHTYNKIQKLAKINSDDCLLIEEMMTKYSRFEHSQSAEFPLDLPTPEEIKVDIEKIIVWLKEFKKRPIE